MGKMQLKINAKTSDVQHVSDLFEIHFQRRGYKRATYIYKSRRETQIRDDVGRKRVEMKSTH